MQVGDKTKDIQYVSREPSVVGKLAERLAVLTFQMALLRFWEVRKRFHYWKKRETIWEEIYRLSADITEQCLISFLEPITQRTMENLAQQMRE